MPTVAVLGAVALAAGCKAKDEKAADTSTPGAMVAMVSSQVRRLVIDSSLQDPLAGEMTEIRGYNDEQKLAANPSGKDWGPVARLYALKRDRVIGDYTRAEGAMVAVLEVDPDANMPQTYRHLDIADNAGTAAQVYCVFLYRTNDSQNPWKGGVAKATGSTCATPASQINADSVKEPGFQANADFPPYAVRFTEANNGAPSLGVRCMNAICEIGNAVGTSHNSGSPSSGKVGKIRTWHDDQEIAEAKSGSGGGFQRGPLSSITPVDGLAAMSAEFKQPNGAQAATIHVTGAAPIGAKYATWGLAADSDTEVWLKNDSNVWSIQFKTNGASTAWTSITQNPHTKDLVPGTARWVWNPADEGIWMACDQGCCEFGMQKGPKQNNDSLPPKPDTGKGKGKE